MRWYQEDCDNAEPKITLLKKKYHSGGNGIYKDINRLIAKHVEKDTYGDWGFLDKDFTENIELLIDETGAESEKFLKEVIDFCVEKQLLFRIGNRIANYRILERADRYTADICKKLGTDIDTEVKKLKKLCEDSVKQTEQILHTDSTDTAQIVEAAETETTPTNNTYKTNNTNIGESASPKVESSPSTSVLGVDLSHVLDKKPQTGINYSWQEKCFRHAEYLAIDLKNNPALKSRMLRFYKENYGSKVESVVSNLYDAPGFKALKSAEEKMKYFFSVFYSKT